jgi:hypothetical protein
MRKSKLITIAVGALLAIGGIAQVSGSSGQGTCTLGYSLESLGETKETATHSKGGRAQPCIPTAPNSSSGRPSSTNPTKRHKVTLSWNPTVPATNFPRDAIIGYNVYRTTTAGSSYDDKNKLNSTPLLGTKCVDMLVEPGRTYFYVTKAVSASGAVSGPSNEAKAVIPDP